MANPTIPTVPVILDTAKICLSAAIKDRFKKNTLYNGMVADLLPEKIYLIWKSVQHRYDKNPIDKTLRDTSNLLWSLLGRYHLTLGQGGGTVVTGNGGSVCPFGVGAIFITGADLDADNIYLNSGFAQDLLVFYNGGQRYLILNTEWEYVKDGDGSVVGVKILFGSFTSEDVFVISPNPKCGSDSASAGATVNIAYGKISFNVGDAASAIPITAAIMNDGDTQYTIPYKVMEDSVEILYNDADVDQYPSGDFNYQIVYTPISAIIFFSAGVTGGLKLKFNFVKIL